MWQWHGMGPWGWLIMLAIWALVILSIVWVVRATDRRNKPELDQPLRILDERLARGEIDPEEYEVRRRTLKSHL
jgi:putative membrane protein